MSQYEDLGVDAHKTKVKEIFGRIIDNEYPLAFCNIVQDNLNRGYVKTQHMDGDGSKFIQRILHFKETGDPTVFRGAVDDALSMNTGDIAASGFVDELDVTDVININGANVPKDIVMEQIAIRFEELKHFYKENGFNFSFLGGETADLPDQVKSIAFDVAVSSRVHESRLIAGNVQHGDVIFGMWSNGKAFWEEEENSGVMSNGQTMGRIKLMSSKYNTKYPELMRQEKPFEGRFEVNDPEGRKVSDALLSPTRQWAIVIRKLIALLWTNGCIELLHGIVMNTGGGASKILNIGENICYKKKMPEPPEIFQLIQRESGEEWEHMFTSFNCGVGIDIVGSPEDGLLESMVNDASRWSGVGSFKLGECLASEGDTNQLVLDTKYGTFRY